MYVGGVERERLTRYGNAMITSAILKTMGGVSVSAEELIGEPPPPSQIPGMDPSPEQRFIEHLEKVRQREEQQHAEWLQGLGLAPPSAK